MSVDKSNFGRVAVLFGGTSAEREISLVSGQAVLSALQGAGINAEAFDPAERNIADIKAYDRAFIVLHGRGGEDGTMQGALELLNIPYTGSGVLASALGMDKTRTKQLWLGCGLPTPPYARLHSNTNFEQVIADLGLPLMVKPAREGSSIGMRKVETAQDLEPAYAFAAQYDSEIIAEKWVTGKEYTIVILGDKALPVIRLQPHQSHGFYDFDAKYKSTDTQYLCPCGLAADDEQRLQALAVKAFDMVGAKGWGRIDAMQDQEGNFWLLEVNTVPGMTDHSLVPMAARAAGLSFQELVVQILAQTH
jgi:D-alanine-D-alanine ligase